MNKTINAKFLEDVFQEISDQPPWRDKADREKDYEDGNQLDSNVLRMMQEKGIPPSIENLIGQALDDIYGMERKNRRDWRVKPDDCEGADDIALALNQKLNRAERKSRADKACSSAYESQASVGIGWVEVSRDSDPFKFPYRVRNVHRNEMWWDMKATEPDLSDARWLLRRRWTNLDVATMTFPKHKELIANVGKGLKGFEVRLEFDGGSSTGLSQSWDDDRGWSIEEDEWRDSESGRICLFELQHRIWMHALILKLDSGRVVEFNPKDQFHTMAVASGMPVEKRPISKIRQSFWLGPHLLGDRPSEFQKFNYVPFWGKIEDRTRVPYGISRPLMYGQDEVNARISKMQWLLSSTQTVRTAGAVAMSDEVFRQEVGRPDADIILDAKEMAKPGARFEINRNLELNKQQYERLLDLRESIKNLSGATDALSGNSSTDNSSALSQAIEQSVQSLARINENFAFGRSEVGQLLLTLIINDMDQKREEVVLKGNAIRESRTIVLNDPVTDDLTQKQYLNNDVTKVKLMVDLEDVPSTATFRQQQLAHMEQVLKSLPASIQPVLVPYFMNLTDVPEKEELIKAIRQAIETPSPDQIQQQIKDAVEKAKVQWMYDHKQRELDIRERKSDAEIEKIIVDTVSKAIESIYSATQAGQTIAAMPGVAPVADQVLRSAGFEDRDAAPIVAPAAGPIIPQPVVRENTSPMFPARVQEPDLEAATSLPTPAPDNPGVGMNAGIEA